MTPEMKDFDDRYLQERHAIREREDAEIVDAAMQKLGWLKPGRAAPESALVVPRFHLRSIRIERPQDTPSQMAIELAHRLQPMFDGPGHIKWYGDPFDKMPTASSIIASMLQYPPPERISKIMEFYYGQQWDTDVRVYRRERPTLTVNMLPALTAAALDAQRKADLPELGPDDKERLMVILAFRNRDAQVMYNYMVSYVAEITSLDCESRRVTIKAAEPNV